MRINKEKFPILDILRMSKEEFLEKKPLVYGENITNTIEKGDWFIVEEFIEGNFESLKRILKFGNIDMVSNTFMNNVLKNGHLYEKFKVDDILEECQVFGMIMLDTQGFTLLYHWDKNASIFFFIAITGGNFVTAFEWYNSQKIYTGVADSYIDSGGEYVSGAKNAAFFRTVIEYILLFKHYAKVETIHVKPKEKVRDPNSKEKHFNETDIPINILDCRWFNNIIRDEPFGVRGHFRLQPKKDKEGKWIKEMIYIKPFIKTGYNIKAKKPDNK